MMVQKSPVQEWNVSPPLSQGIRRMGMTLDSVIKILTHLPLGHQFFQAHVRGGDHAHVNLHAATTA
jgi:hypothetical protein